MGLLNLRRIGPLTYLVAAASTLVLASPATAQAPIKFSLDSRIEGPDALILLPLDRAISRAGAGRERGRRGPRRSTRSPALQPAATISPSLISTRSSATVTSIVPADQSRVHGVQRPPYAIVTRKSRGITEPKQLEGESSAHPHRLHVRAMAAVRQAQRHRRGEGDDREHRHRCGRRC